MLSLNGLLAVEAGDLVGAQYCGMLLAALGARVIRVDDPAAGQCVAEGGCLPGETGREASLRRLHLGPGKQSAAIAYSRPAGADLLRQLLARADIYVDGLGHQQAASLRLAAADLSSDQVNNHLIVASVSWFGQDGPYRDLEATDLTCSAMSGYVSLNGYPGQPPLAMPVPLGQYLAGLNAAIGICALLLSSQQAGLRHLDVSAQESLAIQLAGAATDALRTGNVARRAGNRMVARNGGRTFTGVLPCADGHVVVAVVGEADYLRLAELGLDIGQLPAEARTRPGSFPEAIDDLVRPWLAGRRREELSQAAQAVGLHWSEILSPGEAATTIHSAARNVLGRYSHPLFGPLPYVRVPVRPRVDVRDTEAEYRLTGADTVTVLAGDLGLTPAEVQALVADGTVVAAGGAAPAPAPDAPADPGGRPAISPAAASAPADLPLTGLRVIEVGTMVAGPYACAILADLGADVIKVESPGGDTLRRSVKFAGTEHWFTECNRGKRSLGLDLASTQGRDILARLVQRSDAIVFNLRPDTVAKLGLSHAELRKINPSIVAVQVSAFGSDGPWGSRRGTAPTVDGSSGISSINGDAGSGPLKPPNLFGDLAAAFFAALGVVAAIRTARSSGRGEYLDVAMGECVLHMLGEAVLRELALGQPAQPRGNAHETYGPHGTYPCAGDDDWIAIAVRSDADWQRFARAMDPALLRRAQYADAEGRRSNRGDLDRHVASLTASCDKLELMARLQAAGVACGVVSRPDEVAADPQLAGRGFFGAIASVRAETEAIVRFPGRPSIPAAVTSRRRSPNFSEHAAEVLTGVLQYSPSEVEEFFAGRVSFPAADDSAASTP